MLFMMSKIYKLFLTDYSMIVPNSKDREGNEEQWKNRKILVYAVLTAVRVTVSARYGLIPETLSSPMKNLIET